MSVLFWLISVLQLDVKILQDRTAADLR